jgi:hypothetical protein
MRSLILRAQVMGVNGVQITGELAGIALHGMGIAQHKADGVVQFVRHARHQPAQRGHFLGLHQLGLGRFQRLMRRLQLGIGALEFAHRPPTATKPL